MPEKVLSVDEYIMDEVIKKIDQNGFLGLQTIERISLFIIAMAIGCKYNQRTPLQHKHGLIRSSAIDSEKMAILQTVCLHDIIEKEGNYDDINDIEQVFKVAEEYANTGFHKLEEEVKQFESSDDSNMDVWTGLHVLDEKYKVIFEGNE